MDGDVLYVYHSKNQSEPKVNGFVCQETKHMHVGLVWPLWGRPPFHLFLLSERTWAKLWFCVGICGLALDVLLSISTWKDLPESLPMDPNGGGAQALTSISQQRKLFSRMEKGRDKDCSSPAALVLSSSSLGKPGFEFHSLTGNSHLCMELTASFNSHSFRTTFPSVLNSRARAAYNELELPLGWIKWSVPGAFTIAREVPLPYLKAFIWSVIWEDSLFHQVSVKMYTTAPFCNFMPAQEGPARRVHCLSWSFKGKLSLGQIICPLPAPRAANCQLCHFWCLQLTMSEPSGQAG